MELNGLYIGGSLAGEQMSGYVLSGTFVGVDLSNANLSYAVLTGTFIMVSLRGANLRGADLSNARMIRVDARDAVLPGDASA